MESLIIRPAKAGEYQEIYTLLECAFREDPNSDHNEAHIVDRLRQESNFFPEFSLVAVQKNMIIGYILLSEVDLLNKESSHKVLALAPLAVLPEFQNKGVGSSLIKKAHQAATKKAYPMIIVLGHDTYYPKFGYKKAKSFNISVPFNIPSQYVMVKELQPYAGASINGKVKYPPPFYL